MKRYIIHASFWLGIPILLGVLLNLFFSFNFWLVAGLTLVSLIINGIIIQNEKW
jgi:hypothetical protein